MGKIITATIYVELGLKYNISKQGKKQINHIFILQDFIQNASTPIAFLFLQFETTVSNCFRENSWYNVGFSTNSGTFMLSSYTNLSIKQVLLN